MEFAMSLEYWVKLYKAYTEEASERGCLAAVMVC